jgi:hypothetical protein
MWCCGGVKEVEGDRKQLRIQTRRLALGKDRFSHRPCLKPGGGYGRATYVG